MLCSSANASTSFQRLAAWKQSCQECSSNSGSNESSRCEHPVHAKVIQSASQQGATRNWVGDSFWIQVGPQHRCSTWGRKCSKILSDLDVTSRGTAAQHRANAGWESLAHWNPTMCFFPQGGHQPAIKNQLWNHPTLSVFGHAMIPLNPCHLAVGF